MAYTKYPNQIDSSTELPIAVDKKTQVIAEVVNRLRDAILAVESELGINPSREYGTVRARLDAMMNIIASGPVFGPVSSTDNAVARFDGVIGTRLQNSLVIVNDAGDITTPGTALTLGDVSTITAKTSLVLQETDSPTSLTLTLGIIEPSAGANILWPATVSSERNLGITVRNDAAGQDFRIYGQGTTFVGASGGNLILHAGAPGAGGANGCVIIRDPTNTGQIFKATGLDAACFGRDGNAFTLTLGEVGAGVGVTHVLKPATGDLFSIQYADLTNCIFNDAFSVYWRHPGSVNGFNFLINAGGMQAVGLPLLVRAFNTLQAIAGSSIVLGYDDAASVLPAVTTYCKGADHTFAGSGGTNIIWRAGMGAGAVEGFFGINSASNIQVMKVTGPDVMTLGRDGNAFTLTLGETGAGASVNHSLVTATGDNLLIAAGTGASIHITPNGGTYLGTSTGVYVSSGGVFLGITTWGIVLSNTYHYSYLPFTVKVGSGTDGRPLNGDNITFGIDDGVNVLAGVTAVVRAANLTAGGSTANSLAIHAGLGPAGAQGALKLQSAAGIDVVTINANDSMFLGRDGTAFTLTLGQAGAGVSVNHILTSAAGDNVHYTSGAGGYVAVAPAGLNPLTGYGIYCSADGLVSYIGAAAGWRIMVGATFFHTHNVLTIKEAASSLPLTGNCLMLGADDAPTVLAGVTAIIRCGNLSNAASSPNNLTIRAGNSGTYGGSLYLQPGSGVTGDDGYLELQDSSGLAVISITPDSKSQFHSNMVMTGDYEFLPYLDDIGSIGAAGRRFSLVRAKTITSGDIGFDDEACPLCDQPFKEGEELVLKVMRREFDDRNGQTVCYTVPTHLNCAHSH